jgi:hypothetical protein
MKQANNNEIDLLLRSLARAAKGDSPSDTRGVSRREEGAFSDHLDADELNSFAEGVVPAPARTRYIAHLADCGSCRAIVVDLTRASGATARSENLERQTESGLWQNFAALFSAPVLRYAIPALALTAVIAISFFALRQQRRPDLVAQKERTNSEAPVPIQQSEPSITQSNPQAPVTIPGSPEPRTAVESTIDKKTIQAEKGGDARSRTEAAELDAPAAPAINDSVASKQGSAAGLAGAKPPVFAPEPAPPPPAFKPALSEDKATALKKEELARREVQALPVEAEKNQPRDEAGRHGPSRSNTMLGGSKRADGLMSERAEPGAKSKKDSDDEVETRSVSGRRFRRQGSAWIDTAYDSSRRTINISRGSEQFRALIADEPAIRTIAEKLNGVVIVVWNGRAYRIQ